MTISKKDVKKAIREMKRKDKEISIYPTMENSLNRLWDTVTTEPDNEYKSVWLKRAGDNMPALNSIWMKEKEEFPCCICNIRIAPDYHHPIHKTSFKGKNEWEGYKIGNEHICYVCLKYRLYEKDKKHIESWTPQLERKVEQEKDKLYELIKYRKLAYYRRRKKAVYHLK